MRITIETPSEHDARIGAAFEQAHGRRDGETDAALVKRLLEEHLRSVVRAHEVREAQAEAQRTVIERVDADLGGASR
jgi:hypothetical protein